MKPKTVWKADDRQGTKYFAKRPMFIAGHDVFTGDQVERPAFRSKVRIIQRFVADVTGDGRDSMGYPKKIQVRPR